MKKKYILEKSNRKDKKLMVKNGKTIHFGAKGYSDFTLSKDTNKKKNYIKRHIVNEDFNNPKTAGSLSRHILWGDSTSLSKNISAFKSKFKV